MSVLWDLSSIRPREDIVVPGDTIPALFCNAAQARGDAEPHRAWIRFLLERYYDPMYDWQLTQKRGTVLFRGRRHEVIDWINSRND